MQKDELGLFQEYCAVLVSANAVEEQTNNIPEKIDIAKEYERVRKSWSNLLSGPLRNEVIKRYIRFQQQILLDLADMVYGSSMRKTNKRKTVIRELIDFLLEALMRLTRFLHHYFRDYINEDSKIPDAEVAEIIDGAAAAMKPVNEKLNLTQIDSRLKTCIRHFLDEAGTSGTDGIFTYRSRIYLAGFIASLAVVVESKAAKDLTGQVIETLIYLNFNQAAFCRWYQDYILTRKNTLAEDIQLSFLMEEQLRLKTIPVNHQINYDPAVSPVNEILINWLEEAIKLDFFQADGLTLDTPSKLELRLTVAQLTLLIRLLHEEGVFAINNISELLRFFSAWCMTKKQVHISYRSLNKLYYSSDQFTGSAVKILLLSMVGRINKMFFPA